jgi:hypothetical protein
MFDGSSCEQYSGKSSAYTPPKSAYTSPKKKNGKKIWKPILIVGIIALASTGVWFATRETSEEKQARLAREEQQRIELEKREEEQRIEKEKQEAEKRAAEEARLEKERKEREIYNKYINNSLQTGATPYHSIYGGNPSCDNYGCSQITVRTPSNSDVLVTIKKNGNVVRHAYIRSNSSYTFEIPDGTYQPFFYYGRGWNPEKIMKETANGTIKGGFIEDESFGKDDPQILNSQILQYELILQRNGNFSLRPSNAAEAL